MPKRRHLWLLSALTIMPAAHAEPPALGSVTVEAQVAPDFSASVEALYFLEPAGASEVGFTSIVIAGSRAANVRAFVVGRELSFVAHADAEGRFDGAIRLPASEERIPLRVTYEVLAPPDEASSAPEVTIPLLVVRWPPRETRAETFAATVTLPPGVVAHSGFPSDFEQIASIDRTSPANVYRFTLPVMPSLLRLRTSTGKPPLLTVERTADLATVVVLLALGVIGWRRLREGLA